jgi:hypothetical protein
MPQIPGRALAKLNIVAYSKMDDKGNFDSKVGRFIALYNPTDFEFNTGTELAINYTAGGGAAPVQDLYQTNRELKIEFFVDGTGTSPPLGIPLGWAMGAIGNVGGGASVGALVAQASLSAVASAFTVTSYINYFFKIAASSTLRDTPPTPDDPLTTDVNEARVNPQTHQSNYLKLIWGAGFRFNCKLATASVKYTLFNQLGQPLRATIKATFTEIAGNKEKSRLQSPDLTKVHLVKAGDTIYNLAEKEYGSESYYLQIAQANDLINYRKLTPGQTLVLPPIAKIE